MAEGEAELKAVIARSEVVAERRENQALSAIHGARADLEQQARDLRGLIAAARLLLASPPPEENARLRGALDPKHWRGKPHSVLVNIVLDLLAQEADNGRT